MSLLGGTCTPAREPTTLWAESGSSRNSHLLGGYFHPVLSAESECLKTSGRPEFRVRPRMWKIIADRVRFSNQAIGIFLPHLHACVTGRLQVLLCPRANPSER